MTIKELIEQLLGFPMDLPVAVEAVHYDRCGDSYHELEPLTNLCPRRLPANERGDIKSWQSYDATDDATNPNVLVVE